MIFIVIYLLYLLEIVVALVFTAASFLPTARSRMESGIWLIRAVTFGLLASYILGVVAIVLDPHWEDNGVMETITFPDHFSVAFLPAMFFQFAVVPISVAVAAVFRKKPWRNHFNWTLMGFILYGVISAMACANASTNGQYGERITYNATHPIQYPDFQVRYLGKKPQSHPSVSGDVYDFLIIPPRGLNLGILRSAGTGDIGPSLFKINNQCFALEMKRSDTLGPLKENEVVIKTAPETWCLKIGSAALPNNKRSYTELFYEGLNSEDKENIAAFYVNPVKKTKLSDWIVKNNEEYAGEYYISSSPAPIGAATVNVQSDGVSIIVQYNTPFDEVEIPERNMSLVKKTYTGLIKGNLFQSEKQLKVRFVVWNTIDKAGNHSHWKAIIVEGDKTVEEIPLLLRKREYR